MGQYLTQPFLPPCRGFSVITPAPADSRKAQQGIYQKRIIMTLKPITIWMLAAVCLLFLVMPIQADAIDDQTVIYQQSFANDPHWVTNSPTYDYWEPGAQRYHFSIEPSTGGYAYVPVDFQGTSFNLDYDLLLTRMDNDATFRFAFSSKEMDPEKGPCIVTEFTNAKYGKIMWLQVVTPANKILYINSQSGVTAYTGSTAKYEVNKTYHVGVAYNKEQNIISMKVSDKQTGQELWGYFIKLNDELKGMNRLWLGSIGDYGAMNIYAQGYIDNVQLTEPAGAVATPTEAAPAGVTTAATATPTKKAPSKTVPKTTVPATSPPATQSPSSVLLPLAALGTIIGGFFLLGKKE